MLDLQTRHRIIGDVRGKGLMLGMELVRDRDSKEPASAEAKLAHERCKDYALLIGKGGVHGNVLRIKPPMCISREDADYIADVLDLVLGSLNS